MAQQVIDGLYLLFVTSLVLLWLRVVWTLLSSSITKIIANPDELVSDDKSVPREIVDQLNEYRDTNQSE